jgi:LmbE family N-acetylglucosaminyl deacetylase
MAVAAHSRPCKLRLLAVLAHPDDESLGLGGTLARYAGEGVEISLITATRGERGRNGESRVTPQAQLAAMREGELRSAANVLGISNLCILGYPDGELDRAEPNEAVTRIAAQIRRWKPHVVVTFGPEGAYGHPDHIAISQLAGAAIVHAAHAKNDDSLMDHPQHQVLKFYYMAWTAAKWEAYQSALKKLTAKVDGCERQATPWPDWAITTVIDTTEHWPTAWRAISCHTTQMSIYRNLQSLSNEQHRSLWGSQEFYRVFSLANGGRTVETDLFAGIRNLPGRH